MSGHPDYADIDHKPIRLTLFNTQTEQEDTAHALWPESIPLIVLWRMYDAIHQIDLPAAISFVRFGLYLAGKDERDPSDHEIMEILMEISHLNAGKRYTKSIDRLLSLSHALLHIKQLTYTEAAAFASRQLMKTISADAWRMRVARWAEDNGLPKVEQRKRTS